MRIAIIGAAGHYHQALEGLRAGDEIVSVAPGESGEDIASLVAQAKPERVYGSVDELLEGGAPDVAVINAPYDLNAPLAMRFLTAGAHVYEEKPLATTLPLLDALTQTWRESGRALGGMFNHRTSGWFRAVQESVARGDVGEVRLVEGRKSYRLGTRPAFYRERARYGGMTPWVGIHMIDLALALCGPCARVYGEQDAHANRGNGELETVASALLCFESGALATVTADYYRPDASRRHDDDRLRVTGTRGMLEVLDGRVYLENDQPKRELALPPERSPFVRFLDAIYAKTSEKLTLEAIESTKIALLARESGDLHTSILVK